MRKLQPDGGHFAGLLMVLLTAAVANPGPDNKPARQLKVLTYNIHHGAGIDGVLDLERIAQVIEKSGADVVGLQEVDNHWSERSNWVDQAGLARGPAEDALRVRGEPRPAAAAIPGEPRRQYGTAVLSKYPIKNFTNTLLPLYPTGEQRGLAVATIKVRGVDLRFANTHLTSNNNAERLEQAKKVVELLAGSKTPTILVGDLNASPTAPEITTLTAVWRDTWPRSASGPATPSRRTTRPSPDRLPAAHGGAPPDLGRRYSPPRLRPPAR